jgi:hypothetical protein
VYVEKGIAGAAKPVNQGKDSIRSIDRSLSEIGHSPLLSRALFDTPFSAVETYQYFG